MLIGNDDDRNDSDVFNNNDDNSFFEGRDAYCYNLVTSLIIIIRKIFLI